ncbi:hypothetical protein BsWGS_23634 [Bradybaena similaris]
MYAVKQSKHITSSAQQVLKVLLQLPNNSQAYNFNYLIDANILLHLPNRFQMHYFWCPTVRNLYYFIWQTGKNVLLHVFNKCIASPVQETKMYYFSCLKGLNVLLQLPNR